MHFFTKTCMGIFFFILALMMLISCEQNKKEIAPVVRPVKTMTIGKNAEQVARNFPGKVLASNRVDLSFDVPGLLIELPVLEGNRIEKGQLIAKLDPQKYQQVVNETEAKYLRAKAQLERYDILIKDKYVSQEDYDTTRAAFLVTEADLNRAKRDLADTEIRAPFTGIIAQKFVDNFQNVQSKQVIVAFHDITHIDIEINVPENLMILLKQNNQGENLPAKNIQATFDAQPNQSYPVLFKEFSSTADPQTQTYRVVFTMPTPTGISVLPGMTATIRAHASTAETAGLNFMLIPAESVFNEEGVSYVWIVDTKKMEVHKTPVKVGQLAGNDIRINSGLKSGDVIVTAGVHFLRDGQKVKILEN